MCKLDYNHIYGPVSSWRLGRSLGVDLLPEQKVCSFDCIYCQLGKTKVLTNERKIYVSTKEIIKEIKSLPGGLKIDYVTFSGMGEPALARNLGAVIKAIRRLKKGTPIGVITNGSLLKRRDVRRELALADFVMVKLDAQLPRLFKLVNRPTFGIDFEGILEGISNFRKDYKGKLALQIMFVKENKKSYRGLADLAKRFAPDEIQINTPLRPCACRPLSKKQIQKIKRYFKRISSSGDKLNVISVYDSGLKEVKPINRNQTHRRRGE